MPTLYFELRLMLGLALTSHNLNSHYYNGDSLPKPHETARIPAESTVID